MMKLKSTRYYTSAMVRRLFYCTVKYILPLISPTPIILSQSLPTFKKATIMTLASIIPASADRILQTGRHHPYPASH